MAIAEAQLETWAHQGKTGQLTETHQAIRSVLLDGNAPYPVADCEVFLQGSYANDTNVYADSDIDIVLKHDGTFQRDLSRLSATERSAYIASYPKATYQFEELKNDVTAWISQHFDDVAPGKKALLIPGNGRLRDADVLISQQFRRYHKFSSIGNESYDEGVSFFSQGTFIENFPKQHSENCTIKHQSTKSWFKPMVRIFKNMRNTMIEKGLLSDGLAPSYFVEGLLFNVPKERFGGTYAETWVECFNWIVAAKATELVCANQLHWLVRDGTATSWPAVTRPV